jgi:hypothetical protein
MTSGTGTTRPACSHHAREGPKRPRDPAQVAKLMIDIASGEKVESHADSVGLFAMYYNFIPIHKTLRTTPAMGANVTKWLWEIDDIVDVLEAWEVAN